MKPSFLLGGVAAIVIALVILGFQKDTQEPWTEQQLMQPSVLADKLKAGNTKNTVIYNIGPSGKIKGSVDIGPAQDAESMDLLKSKLAKLPKNTEVVLYCGCCPFRNCPNIRPAFNLLNDMKFANAKLLDIPKNLKVDWIDKGYPMQN